MPWEIKITRTGYQPQTFIAPENVWLTPGGENVGISLLVSGTVATVRSEEKIIETGGNLKMFDGDVMIQAVYQGNK